MALIRPKELKTLKDTSIPAKFQNLTPSSYPPVTKQAPERSTPRADTVVVPSFGVISCELGLFWTGLFSSPSSLSSPSSSPSERGGDKGQGYLPPD